MGTLDTVLTGSIVLAPLAWLEISTRWVQRVNRRNGFGRGRHRRTIPLIGTRGDDLVPTDRPQLRLDEPGCRGDGGSQFWHDGYGIVGAFHPAPTKADAGDFERWEEEQHTQWGRY